MVAQLGLLAASFAMASTATDQRPKSFGLQMRLLAAEKTNTKNKKTWLPLLLPQWMLPPPPPREVCVRQLQCHHGNSAARELHLAIGDWEQSVTLHTLLAH